jgi:hypothetical protein
MPGIAAVQQALVSRDWFSIPVLSAGRLMIEFHFEADGSGWSRYSIWGYEDVLPQIIESSWTYTVEDKQLRVAWDDGTCSSIDYGLTFEAKLSFARNEEHSFDAVLRVAEHLFPKSSGFSDGWLKDYWGRARKDSGTGHQTND